MAPAKPPQQGSTGSTTSRIGRSNSVNNRKASVGSSVDRTKPPPQHEKTDSADNSSSKPDLATYAANQDPGSESPIDLATYAANQDPVEPDDATEQDNKSEAADPLVTPAAEKTTAKTLRVIELQNNDDTGTGRPLVTVKLNLYQTLAQLRRQLKGIMYAKRDF